MSLRAIDLIHSRHWAMTPDAVQQLAKIVLNRDISKLEAAGANIKDLVDQDQIDSSVFHAGKIGAPMQHTHQAEVRDGVAIIPISGPIFSKANLMTAHSGATSMHKVSHDLAVALENPSVKSIIINLDSPGGIAFGPAELAQEIREASKIKRVVAYAGGLCCSAAYWIAAGAGEIVAHKSAMLGSIGVVTAMSFQEKPDQHGDRWVEIVSSNAKNKRHDVSTDEGKAQVVKELDAIETEFIDTIAQYRGVERQAIISDFGGGGVLIASEAVKVGMADRLGSFEELLSELSLNPQQPSSKGDNQMTGNKVTAPATTTGEENVTPEAIRQEGYDSGHEAGVEAGKKEGFETGAQAERERIAGIEEVAIAGHEQLIADAKADGKTTGPEVAAKILAAQKQLGSDHLATLKTDAEKQPEIAPSGDNDPAAAAPDANDESIPLEDRAQAQWDASTDIRKEFGTFETYLAFRKGEASGKVKIKD